MLPYHTRPACPAEYVPLLYISFLMVIFGVCIHFLYNFFQTPKSTFDSFMYRADAGSFAFCNIR